MITDPDAASWRGTRAFILEGKNKAAGDLVPLHAIRDYIFSRANPTPISRA